MATIGGARTLHMESEIGSLEVGKKADLIVLGLDAPNAVPLYDVYPQVECAEGRGCQDRHYWWAGGAAGSPRAYARPGRDRVARRRIRERGQEITSPTARLVRRPVGRRNEGKWGRVGRQRPFALGFLGRAGRKLGCRLPYPRPAEPALGPEPPQPIAAFRGSLEQPAPRGEAVAHPIGKHRAQDRADHDVGDVVLADQDAACRDPSGKHVEQNPSA